MNEFARDTTPLQMSDITIYQAEWDLGVASKALDSYDSFEVVPEPILRSFSQACDTWLGAAFRELV